jgi:hypothetical protein
MARTMIAKPEEVSPNYRAVASAANADVESESDGEYIDALARTHKKKREQQPQDFKRFYYGRPPPSQ